MSDTNDTTQAQPAPSLPPYAIERYFVTPTGRKVGPLPADATGVEFVDAEGSMFVDFATVGIDTSRPGLFLSLAVNALLSLIGSSFSGVPTASKKEENAGKSYAELGRAALAARLEKFARNEVPGIHSASGTSAAPSMFARVLAKMLNAPLADVEARISAKRSELTSAKADGKLDLSRYVEWQAATKESPAYKLAHAALLAEEAQAAGGADSGQASIF